MLTWGTLLSDLWLDMGDAGDNHRLEGERAYLYLRFALQDYSQWNPLGQAATLDLDDTGTAPLPDNYLRLYDVREAGTHKIILPARGGSNPPGFSITARALRYWIEGNNLRVNSWANSPDRVDLHYGAYHTQPTDAADIEFALTLPLEDEEAIILYMRAKFIGATRSRTALLDRYKPKNAAGNTRKDNPLTPEESDLMAEYLALMIQKYGSHGSISLRRRR
ncbi:hypothetical protein [Aggregatilinea lenta]|uniref:hypothetical protein n=1 Tax=Aggregatilinea lenta TaxID=913108 RepID=UPI000E5B5A1D|nr:hypothetical protein [Aggregatilinea lenta]